MKTKIYFITLMLTGIVVSAKAQAQNPECMTNLSIFSEHVKVKNFDAAYAPWKMVYDNCPEINWAVYAYGERILKDKLEKSSGSDKDKLINELVAVYDKGAKHFPDKAPKAKVIIDKVLLRYDNKTISDDEVYSMLDQAFKEDRENFKNPKALYLYFSSLVDLNGAGKKDLQEVFDVYDEVTGKIDEENEQLTDIISKLLPKDSLNTLTAKEKQLLSSSTTNSESFGQIAGSIDAKLGALADCGNLIPLYERSFEAKKGDVTWVKRAVGRMFNKECTDDPMFRKLFEAQLALDPSADAYVYGGTLKSKAGDTKGAVADFDKALSLETDGKKRSNIAYKVATIYRNSNKSTARSYAQKAIAANPSNGRAYLLIASLYANSANDCGTTPFEKRAVYWKAAEMAYQAGRVDPSLKSRADQAAASYNAKAPTKEMIFTSGMAGKSIPLNCWVGGSVTVPSL